MAKKSIATTSVIRKVPCTGCIYKERDDGVLMWCANIKMPQPTQTLKNCIHKILK